METPDGTAEYINELTEQEMKQIVLDGTLETAIADSGATSSCGKESISECGTYRLKDPFASTGRPSNKLFQYTGGHIGAGKEPKRLPYEVGGEAQRNTQRSGHQNPFDKHQHVCRG